MKDFAPPVFSIIVPTRNRPVEFHRAVSSIERQSFRDFELIAVDDCSSQQYADEICRSVDFSCRIIGNVSNLGAAGSRNAGIAIARGKYISFLDDDDEFCDSFLQSTYDCLKNTSGEVGLSWCSAQCIDYPGTKDARPVLRDRVFDTGPLSRSELFEQLLSIGIGFGVTIKMDCLEKVGMFDCDLKAGEDTDMFLRVLNAGFLPKVVPGIQITLHNHTNPRLTNLAMHSRRIMEGEKLLVQHADFLRKFPNIDKKIRDHLEFLQGELDSHSSLIAE